MLILGLHTGTHDACACLFDDYRLLAAVAEERVSRRKGDGGTLPLGAMDECLAIAGLSRADVEAVVLDHGAALPEGLRPGVQVGVYDHHLAHALPALFHTDWPEALLYAADTSRQGAWSLRGGRLSQVVAQDGPGPGRLYGAVTEALGFSANRHEGKLTGLAGHGAPVALERLRARFSVDAAGRIRSDLPSGEAMRALAAALCREIPREDAAASAQALLEDVVLEALRTLLATHGVRRLGLSGGVFANVRLNQRLAEELPLDELFVYPAMGDQGLAVGGVLQFLLERDGTAPWLERRWPLDHLYFGRDWGPAADAHFAADPLLERMPGDPVAVAADLLHQGRIVAIFTKGMEYGPRALGARSILAPATDAAVNRTLNARLARSDFMPFAPVVREEDADAVFAIPAAARAAARFMTVTCAVRDGWRGRIPAVVHVDGTARPQVVGRGVNPLYHDVIGAYAARSGIPVLINTSFNVHEEPIIATPAQCARALREGRVDFVLTEGAVWRPRGVSPRPIT